MKKFLAKHREFRCARAAGGVRYRIHRVVINKEWIQ